MMDTKAACVLGICIVGAALIVSLVPRNQPVPAPPEVSRYQVISNAGSNNCFMLDTKTGRLWERFVESNTGPTDWKQENDSSWVDAPGK